MVFFQLVLLAGYCLRRLLDPPRLRARLQAMAARALLAAEPGRPAHPGGRSRCKPVDADDPIRPHPAAADRHHRPALPACCRPPAPLVQAWFARPRRQRRVYRLYALSNVASMGALVAYPVLIEPLTQRQGAGLGLERGLRGVRRCWPRSPPGPAPQALAAGAGGRPRLRAAAGCGGLRMRGCCRARCAAEPHPPLAPASCCGSRCRRWARCMLLATTTHITQNVASVPFLWVLPLALYLIDLHPALRRPGAGTGRAGWRRWPRCWPRSCSAR
jgi:hypothetical protein